MQQKAVVILQARMGSSRLPGKVLMPVLGRPIIAYEIERLGLCRHVADIILATSDKKADDPVAEAGKNLGVTVFRGNESDVLNRFYQAAKKADTRYVIRATGDCPLIDPTVCDRAVKTFFEQQADYLVTSPAFAEGLDCEVMTFAALEAAWKEAALPSEREHVTLFIRNHPERFRCLELENETDDSRYRVTVDEPEDFTAIKTILETLMPEHGIAFTFSHVRALLEAHPDIMRLNNGITRNEGLIKSLRDEKDQ